ncbi:MAG: XRE family transcriptional regulator [Ruminiclostridium sp.]|nr:XRE family transcriptional regulator [Ruminiclostridium sp.]
MTKRKVTKQEVLRRMLDLATSGANDPVKLAYLHEEDREEIGGLDLGCLAAFKRCANGEVEVKLVERRVLFQQILDQLKEESEDGPSAFLRALDGGQVQTELVSRR